jgi:hypothetical protein
VRQIPGTISDQAGSGFSARLLERSTKARTIAAIVAETMRMRRSMNSFLHGRLASWRPAKNRKTKKFHFTLHFSLTGVEYGFNMAITLSPGRALVKINRRPAETFLLVSGRVR